MAKAPKFRTWQPWWDTGLQWHVETTPRGFRLLKVMLWRPGTYAGMPAGIRYTYHIIPLYWWFR